MCDSQIYSTNTNTEMAIHIRHRLNINFVKVDFLPMAGLDGFEADCLEYLDTSFITRMLFHAEYFLHQQL